MPPKDIKITDNIPLRIRASNSLDMINYRDDIFNVIQEIELSDIRSGAFLKGVEIGEGQYEIHPINCEITECTLREGDVHKVIDNPTFQKDNRLYLTLVQVYSNL